MSLNRTTPTSNIPMSVSGLDTFIPKLDAKAFKLPKWDPTYGGRDAWRRRAISGLHHLNALDILVKGYVPKAWQEGVNDTLPLASIPSVITREGLHLPLDIQSGDGTQVKLEQVSKESKAFEGTPQSIPLPSSDDEMSSDNTSKKM